MFLLRYNDFIIVLGSRVFVFVFPVFSVFAQIWFSETEDGQLRPIRLSAGVEKWTHTIAVVYTVFVLEQYTPLHQAVVANRHGHQTKHKTSQNQN